MRPLVSIIVEAYNDAENGLGPPSDTIEGLLRQNFPLDQAELILAGSPAQVRVWETIGDLSKSFGAVRLVTVDPAESHYWQLKNKGAAVAAAEFLAFVDCDALPGPHWLRSLTEALQNGAMFPWVQPNTAQRISVRIRPRCWRPLSLPGPSL